MAAEVANCTENEASGRNSLDDNDSQCLCNVCADPSPPRSPDCSPMMLRTPWKVGQHARFLTESPARGRRFLRVGLGDQSARIKHGGSPKHGPVAAVRWWGRKRTRLGTGWRCAPDGILTQARRRRQMPLRNRGLPPAKALAAIAPPAIRVSLWVSRR